MRGTGGTTEAADTATGGAPEAVGTATDAPEAAGTGTAGATILLWDTPESAMSKQEMHQRQSRSSSDAETLEPKRLREVNRGVFC